MRPEVFSMHDRETGVVTSLKLKQLFTFLAGHPELNICIRTRLLGEMWHLNFMRVLLITQKGVIILSDETSRKAVTIASVRDIVQFELDQSLQDFQAHNHYHVKVTYEGD